MFCAFITKIELLFCESFQILQRDVCSLADAVLVGLLVRLITLG